MPIMISRVVKVLEFPKRRTESIATVHVRPKSLSAMIPGGEASTLNLIASMGPLVPALASAVRIFRPWPRAIAAAGVELVLVVSASTNITSTALPVHGVVGSIA